MQLINEVFIGSLTGKTETEQIEMIEKFKETNHKDKIKISISPELVTKEWLKSLKKYNISTIELEVQSTNGYILKRCDYIYNLDDIKKAIKLIKWNRYKTSVQVGIRTSR